MTRLSPEDKNNTTMPQADGRPQGPTPHSHPPLAPTIHGRKTYRGIVGAGEDVDVVRGPLWPPVRIYSPYLNNPAVVSTLVCILLSGLILEILYLAIVALAPLPGLHLSPTPLAAAWPWTLVPSHVLFPGAWTSASIATSPDWTHLVLFAGTLVALTGVYALAIWGVVRLSRSSAAGKRWLLLLLAGTVLFGLTLLFQPALFSGEVFNYIFSGRVLSVYHANPLTSAPTQFPFDPYLRWPGSEQATPHIYGPLWLFIASLLVSIGNGPVATLLLFKGVAFLSHLLNCILVWAILGKIAPDRRLLGTLLYAWNPLALIELAGSGHNEGILLTILLLAVLLYVRGKGRWSEIGALALLGLAISMSLIALLIAPLFICYLVRTERSLPRTLWGACWRIVPVLAMVIPIYLWLWRGASTFLAVTSAIDMRYYLPSPLALLVGPLRWLFSLVAQTAHFPPVMQPISAADATLRASALFIFALIYLSLFGKVRRATTSIVGMHSRPDADQEMSAPGFDVLLDSWSIAIFWYLVLVVNEFWPWYVLWALWIVILRRVDVWTITLLLLSGTALLSYPLLDVAALPIATYQPLLIFGVPLVYLLVGRTRLKGKVLYDGRSEAEKN